MNLTRHNLLKTIPGWEERIIPQPSGNPAEKKRELLEMARRGEKRPSGESKLHDMFYKYTAENSKSYDPIFTAEIRNIAPDWLLTKHEMMKKKKQQILELAIKGEDKPTKKKHPLGKALKAYLCRASSMYDPMLDAELRRIAPHWFTDTAAENKKQLLEMAKRGEKRPIIGKHPLALPLTRYIRPIKSMVLKKKSAPRHCYDAEFEVELRAIAPHWFVDTAAEKKLELLEIAKRGEKRPQGQLGRNLMSYLCKGHRCYDSEFTAKVHQLAPHWFVNTATEKKQQILEIARSGGPKPHWTELGRALTAYCAKLSPTFDAEFNAQLHQLVPHWFITDKDKANQKKEKLLEMARNGEEKPRCRSHPMGVLLSRYLTSDAIFREKIASLAPHWFS